MKSFGAAFPGTCGELFQGALEGIPCLVSCPIDRMAEVRVSLDPDGEGISISPFMGKTRKAMERALAGVFPGRGCISVRRLQGLPEGRGYASSTADILAALHGLYALAGRVLSPEEGTGIALSVEPTDSIAWPGLALLDHREGRIMEFLGTPPPLSVLVLDWGGTVDTEEFNRRDFRGIFRTLEPLHREAFALVREGVERQDPFLVGEGASLSARGAGELLDRPFLGKCLSLCRELGGYGVCVAHSGTIYGILLPEEAALPEGRKELSERASPALFPGCHARLHSLVPGGPRTAGAGGGTP